MKNNDYNLDDEDEVRRGELEQQEAKDDADQHVPVNINRYHDRDGASMAKLELGLWYVENRLKIIDLAYFSIFLLAIFSWSYFFYEFGSYLIKGIPANQMIVKEVLAKNLPNYSYYLERSAVDLRLHPAKIILGTANKRDILAQVQNPNDDYWARFTYYFLNNNEKIGERKGFILPGETKQLLVLGQDISTSFGGIKLAIKDIEWGRINPHEFGVWEKFKEDHLDFKFSNIVFSPSTGSLLTEKTPLNILSFHVENNTSFNYWNVPLIISLYNYKDLVSVISYQLNDFESNSSFDTSFTLPGNFRKITNIEIVPDLDISRDDLYKKFNAPPSVFR